MARRVEGPPGAIPRDFEEMEAAAVVAPLGAGVWTARRERLARLADRALASPLPEAGIVVLAIAFRFFQLTAVGFNSDEAVYTGSAASLAGNSGLGATFPVFRAHPLLFQTLLSLVLRVHESDWTARGFAAAVGVATVAVTYLLGRRLYGRAAGLVAGALLAVMPYDVIVSRQVLLDGLLTLCATGAFYCVARYVESSQLGWLLAAAGAMGASVLAKETTLVLLGSLYAFFVLTPTARMRLAHLGWSVLTFLAVVAVWPLALRLSGHGHTGNSYLLWQLFRRSNHGTWFYFTVLPGWIGPALLAAAIIGLVWLRKESTWRERLLGSWILVPLVFFTLWPVKGFQYLLPIAPALAVLAGRTLAHPLELPRQLSSKLKGASGWRARLGAVGPGMLPRRSLVHWVAAGAVVASLAVPAFFDMQPAAGAAHLAGTGGVSGGRETGLWIRHHVPVGARLLAIGPSPANILEYYGRRRVFALSVSPNARNRNPSYSPVPNPDLSLRTGGFQYLVWDAYTAGRSQHFADELQRLARKFHGIPVYTAWLGTPRGAGGRGLFRAFVIYEVHP